MADVAKTTPRRVLARAHELGAHADCVAADYSGACEDCLDIFEYVFDELYGHAKDGAEFLELVWNDLQEDRHSE